VFRRRKKGILEREGGEGAFCSRDRAPHPEKKFLVVVRGRKDQRRKKRKKRSRRAPKRQRPDEKRGGGMTYPAKEEGNKA